MNKRHPRDVRSRQAPLRELYKKEPEAALITDRGRTTGGLDTDPFHGYMKPGSQEFTVEWQEQPMHRRLQRRVTSTVTANGPANAASRVSSPRSNPTLSESRGMSAHLRPI